VEDTEIPNLAQWSYSCRKTLGFTSEKLERTAKFIGDRDLDI
jgi:hypothetical protein